MPRAKIPPAHSARAALGGRAQSWHEWVLGEQLGLSLLGVPYNSLAPVLAAAGISTPLPLGGNCIHQARVLAELVSWRLNAKVGFLVDGRHHAVLARCHDGIAYYLDPYLGQLQAIRLPVWRGSVVAQA